MRKASLLASLFLLPLMGAAFGASLFSEEPETFCESAYGCTKAMFAIQDDYAKGDATFSQQDLSAFSGPCYHLDSNYNPDIEHYGAFVFEKNGADLLTNGLFFFFYGQDPYAGFSKEEVFKDLVSRGGRFDKTVVEKDHVRLEYPGETQVTYWFRSTQDKLGLVAIGQEIGLDYYKLTFCKFSAH